MLKAVLVVSSKRRVGAPDQWQEDSTFMAIDARTRSAAKQAHISAGSARLLTTPTKSSAVVEGPLDQGQPTTSSPYPVTPCSKKLTEYAPVALKTTIKNRYLTQIIWFEGPSGLMALEDLLQGLRAYNSDLAALTPAVERVVCTLHKTQAASNINDLPDTTAPGDGQQCSAVQVAEWLTATIGAPPPQKPAPSAAAADATSQPPDLDSQQHPHGGGCAAPASAGRTPPADARYQPPTPSTGHRRQRSPDAEVAVTSSIKRLCPAGAGQDANGGAPGGKDGMVRRRALGGVLAAAASNGSFAAQPSGQQFTTAGCAATAAEVTCADCNEAASSLSPDKTIARASSPKACHAVAAEDAGRGAASPLHGFTPRDLTTTGSRGYGRPPISLSPGGLPVSASGAATSPTSPPAVQGLQTVGQAAYVTLSNAPQHGSTPGPAAGPSVGGGMASNAPLGEVQCRVAVPTGPLTLHAGMCPSQQLQQPPCTTGQQPLDPYGVEAFGTAFLAFLQSRGVSLLDLAFCRGDMDKLGRLLAQYCVYRCKIHSGTRDTVHCFMPGEYHLQGGGTQQVVNLAASQLKCGAEHVVARMIITNSNEECCLRVLQPALLVNCRATQPFKVVQDEERALRFGSHAIQARGCVLLRGVTPFVDPDECPRQGITLEVITSMEELNAALLANSLIFGQVLPAGKPLVEHWKDTLRDTLQADQSVVAAMALALHAMLVLVEYIVEHKVAHRDAHPHNITVDAAGRLQYIDTDTVTRLPGSRLQPAMATEESHHGFRGHIGYRAPEGLDPQTDNSVEAEGHMTVKSVSWVVCNGPQGAPDMYGVLASMAHLSTTPARIWFLVAPGMSVQPELRFRTAEQVQQARAICTAYAECYSGKGQAPPPRITRSAEELLMQGVSGQELLDEAPALLATPGAVPSPIAALLCRHLVEAAHQVHEAARKAPGKGSCKKATFLHIIARCRNDVAAAWIVQLLLKEGKHELAAQLLEQQDEAGSTALLLALQAQSLRVAYLLATLVRGLADAHQKAGDQAGLEHLHSLLRAFNTPDDYGCTVATELAQGPLYGCVRGHEVYSAAVRRPGATRATFCKEVLFEAAKAREQWRVAVATTVQEGMSQPDMAQVASMLEEAKAAVVAQDKRQPSEPAAACPVREMVLKAMCDICSAVDTASRHLRSECGGVDKASGETTLFSVLKHQEPPSMGGNSALHFWAVLGDGEALEYVKKKMPQTNHRKLLNLQNAFGRVPRDEGVMCNELGTLRVFKNALANPPNPSWKEKLAGKRSNVWHEFAKLRNELRVAHGGALLEGSLKGTDQSLVEDHNHGVKHITGTQ